jgi:hypothetical protein
MPKLTRIDTAPLPRAVPYQAARALRRDRREAHRSASPRLAARDGARLRGPASLASRPVREPRWPLRERRGHAMTLNITAALWPISPRWRRAIREELVKRPLSTSGPLNRDRRKALEDAIFAVENELEHRSVANGGSAHPEVAIMRAVDARRVGTAHADRLRRTIGHDADVRGPEEPGRSSPRRALSRGATSS